ncbi:MAG: hypothetical protein Tsb0027_12270 [Wenzhouxiangellaceae bacterium]
MQAADLHSSFTLLDIRIDGRWQRLSLQLDAALTRQSSAVTAMPVAHYHGHVADQPDSWVRLSWLDSSWQGAIFLHDELFLLEQRKHVSHLLTGLDRSDSDSVLFRARDLRFLSALEPEHPSAGETAAASDGRALFEGLHGSMPDSGMAVPLTLVVDSQFLDRHGSLATAQALARLNLLNGLFSQQLGTAFHLLNLNLVSDNANMVDPHPSNLLHEFRDYMRTGPGSGIERSGVVNLLSGRDMTGGFVGSAWQGSVCQEHNHFSVNEDFGGLTLSALIMAHELGHTLGAPHDGAGACSDEPFDGIMNAQINGSDQFSACSITEMALELATASCLIDTSELLFRSDFEL